MGLFSSKSSSETTNNTQETNVNNVDNRVTEADEAFVGGNISVSAGNNLSSLTINQTDFGAIDTAGDIAEASINFANQANTRSNETLKNTVSSAVNAVQSIAGNVTRDEGAKTFQFAIVGGAIIAAILLFKRG